MDDWSSWLKTNQVIAVIVLLFGGFMAIAVLALVVGLVITLSGINPGLGFTALFTVMMLGYFSFQYVQGTNAAESVGEMADATATDTDDTDPVTELEQRYVRGEVDDEEFEQRLETIIETEEGIQRVGDFDREAERSREIETETR